MFHKKLVTVIGATGQQGGSILNALIDDGSFKVRGVSRKRMDDKESRKHVEWVDADISTDSVERLAECFSGSYGLFLVTQIGTDEVACGKRVVDAAHKAGVKHLIFSTMPDPAKISGGKWNVPFYTTKATIESYIRDLQQRDKAFQYVTFVNPSIYYENFLTGFAPKVQGEELVFNLPDTKHIVAFSVGEMGVAVVTAFKHPHKYNMKRLHYVGQQISFGEIAKIWSKVTGYKTRWNTMPLDEFGKAFPGAEAYAQMFGYIEEYDLFGPTIGENVDGLCTFETWLLNNREQAENIGRLPIKHAAQPVGEGKDLEGKHEKTHGKHMGIHKQVEKLGR
jgi:uncharacterized protein YbjT (DUF2867 family)